MELAILCALCAMPGDPGNGLSAPMPRIIVEPHPGVFPANDPVAVAAPAKEVAEAEGTMIDWAGGWAADVVGAMTRARFAAGRPGSIFTDAVGSAPP